MLKKNRKIYLSIIPTLFLLFLILTSCSNLEVLSRWAVSDISVNGDLSDWQGKLEYLENEKIAVGIQNNEQNLFVSFTSSDRSKFRQIANSGFTVWINPAGNKGKMLGVQFPIHRSPDYISPLKQGQTENRDYELKLLADKLQKENEFLLINEDDFPLGAYPINNNETGIEVSIRLSDYKINYELKIPVKSADENVNDLNILLGKTLEIGFVSGIFDRPDMGDRNRGANSSMEEGRRPGGGGGRGSRGAPTEGMQRSQPVDFWINVILSRSK